MDSILILAAAAAMFAKAIVDMARIAVDLPRWGPPVVALIVGIGAVILLMLADSVVLTGAVLATSVLAGILAAGSAVGVTELARAADNQASKRLVKRG